MSRNRTTSGVDDRGAVESIVIGKNQLKCFSRRSTYRHFSFHPKLHSVCMHQDVRQVWFLMWVTEWRIPDPCSGITLRHAHATRWEVEWRVVFNSCWENCSAFIRLQNFRREMHQGKCMLRLEERETGRGTDFQKGKSMFQTYTLPDGTLESFEWTFPCTRTSFIPDRLTRASRCSRRLVDSIHKSDLHLQVPRLSPSWLVPQIQRIRNRLLMSPEGWYRKERKSESQHHQIDRVAGSAPTSPPHGFKNAGFDAHNEEMGCSVLHRKAL